MRFGSVCSGIEAASVAFAPLGWEAAWLAEIEPFPSGVLAHHYPDVPNVGDMTAIVRRVLSGEMEAPDLFCGGTPCQAFSVAGKRQSLDDARGNLSLTFCEIADAIDHVRAARGSDPCVVLWENVPGVLSTKDNAFGCFLGALAGSGCELQPPAAANGKRGKWANAGVVLGPRRAVAWRVLDAQYFGLAQRRRRVFVVASARDGFDPAAVLFESDGVRRDTPPRRETREGSARGAADGVGVGSWWDGGQVTQTLDAVLAKGQTMPEKNRFPAVLVPSVAFDTTQITSAANYSSPKPGDPCRPLAAGAHAPAIAFDSRQDCVSSESVFGALGSSHPQAQAVAQSMAVRRLTPRECERLQGFPDDYTAIPWRGKLAELCPDGPRYKALGNSWAVPCVAWIGRRISKQVPA